MHTLKQKIYSIDECFCDLPGYDYLDPEQLGIDLRSEILKCTGIPVCIGVARTKTLAKIAANRIAKKKTDSGIYFLNKEEEETALKGIETGDVWGIGKQHAKGLVDMGERTLSGHRLFDIFFIKLILKVKKYTLP